MQAPLKRWAMGVRYEGTRYHGWQAQLDVSETVQTHVEKALSAVADSKISVVCAGRTDAGVHATGQVIHFDTSAYRDPHSWIFGANSHLPADISALWALPVDDDFHARFSAKRRRYRYVIYNKEARPGILRHAVTWHYKQLDVSKMAEAAQSLVGEHNFSAFRGAHCQSKSAVRTVYACSIARFKDIIVLDIEANAFLMHMVRNIVGSLMCVGSGRHDIAWFKDVLAQGDRQLAGPTAAPNGLYLVDVHYDDVVLPKPPLGPFFLHGTLA